MNSYSIKLLTIIFFVVNLVFPAQILVAAPIKFQQVVQIIKTNYQGDNLDNGIQLAITDGRRIDSPDKSGAKPQPTPTTYDDKRVVTVTTSDIIEDESCECAAFKIAESRFPTLALFALGAIPIVPALIAFSGNDPVTPPAAPTVASPIVP